MLEPLNWRSQGALNGMAQPVTIGLPVADHVLLSEIFYPDREVRGAGSHMRFQGPFKLRQRKFAQFCENTKDPRPVSRPRLRLLPPGSSTTYLRECPADTSGIHRSPQPLGSTKKATDISRAPHCFEIQ